MSENRIESLEYSTLKAVAKELGYSGSQKAADLVGFLELEEPTKVEAAIAKVETPAPAAEEESGYTPEPNERKLFHVLLEKEDWDKGVKTSKPVIHKLGAKAYALQKDFWKHLGYTRIELLWSPKK